MSFAALVTGAVRALWQGASLGVQYNPVFGIGGAVVAAALLGYPRAPRERRFWAGAVIAVAWLAGDGLMILGRTREVVDGVGAFALVTPAWSAYLLVTVWAVVSLGLGYVAPALVGITVGRRVTHGTGWLAATAIAVGASLALSTLIASLGALG
ncbi:MAG: hypothetical protein D9V44_07485 [Actinobacteria bacterium]|nr:MAG: hypothetical protein D9V44_07485 [Actinomycetota bacterium]